MRVAVVQPTLMRYRLPVFAELARRPGVRLKVFHGDVSGPSVAAEGFEAQRVRMTTRRLLGEPLYRRPRQRELAAGRGFDVLVMNWDVHDLDLVPSLLAARRAGVGTVLWGHGTSGRDGSILGRLKRAVARLADTLVLYEPATAARYRAAGLRAFAAPNTVRAPDAPPPVARGDGPLRLLACTRLVEARRLDVLLRAVRDVRDVTLTIVGDGPARPGLERLTADLAIGFRVDFRGAEYDDARLAELHAAADVYAHPAHLGLSALSAMGHGLPVVAGDDPDRHGPEARCVVDGGTGLRFRHDDPAALAETLRRLRDDEPLRLRLATNAYRFVHEERTVPRMVDGLVAAIRSAASR